MHVRLFSSSFAHTRPWAPFPFMLEMVRMKQLPGVRTRKPPDDDGRATLPALDLCPLAC